ncbi:MAG: formylglycine-generating enzyme family protein [Planctomycetota bacterium]
MRYLPAILLFALLLTACSSGGGGGSSGGLSGSLAGTTAAYQIIDLETGTVTASASVPDLLSDPRYRDSHMVFRLVPGGTATIGAGPASFAAQTDEQQQQVSMPRFYAGVFEITQSQWQRLGGGSPWAELLWSAGSAPVQEQGDGVPAYGLSRSLVEDVVGAWSAARGPSLRLPSAAQWEYACRAGSQSAFAWGDDRSASTAAQYAVVFETRSGIDGPQVVGGRTANAFGLYDMHGNCWELTTDDLARGGSWSDPVSLARSANRNPVLADQAHALMGARLLYLP